MTRNIPIAFVFALAALTAGMAQQATPTGSPYSKDAVHELLKGAHTAQQYHMLGEYFRYREKTYEQLALAEKEEWQNLSQGVTSHSAKYPTPAEAAENRYEYLTVEAGKMEDRAVHYETLAANAEKSEAGQQATIK